MSAWRAWFLAACCVAGAACQQIVGIGDRRMAGGHGGSPGIDSAVTLDGAAPVDGRAADAPGAGTDAGADGSMVTGGTPGRGGAAGSGVVSTGGNRATGGVTGQGGWRSDGGGSIGGGGGLATGGNAGTRGGAGGATGSGAGGTVADAGTGGTGTGGTGTGGTGTGGAPSTGGTGGCGDGVKIPTEQCDRGDLGGKTCASIGLGAAGTLGCAADCTLETTGCRPVLVMFGGSPDTGYSNLLGDTWEYANGAWAERLPDNRPGERYAAGLAAGHGGVVLFGGYGYSTPSAMTMSYQNDTWVWDGTDWSLKEPAHRPAARYSPAMGRLGGKVVLFGGWNGSAMCDDTWEWDGNDWNPRSPTHIPPARDAAAMANLGGERLVMFGAGTDTWEWDGNDWSLRSPATVPASRKYLAAATLHGGVIMFGGSSSNQSTATFYADTWRWNGTDWAQLLPAGPPSERRSFALGPLGGSVLMFGGRGPGGAIYEDTWELTGTTWSSRATVPGQRRDVVLAAR